MEVDILLFGITKDLIGNQKIRLEIPGTITVAGVKKILQEKYPVLIDLNSLAIAVNSEYALDDMLIHEEDEIALIPPVSGG